MEKLFERLKMKGNRPVMNEHKPAPSSPRFRKRELRRAFEAGAERVEIDPKTGILTAYKHDAKPKIEEPPPAPSAA
jgi:hypothetical protein